MRRCTGFWPSLTSGRARPLTTESAYSRYARSAYSASAAVSPPAGGGEEENRSKVVTAVGGSKGSQSSRRARRARPTPARRQRGKRSRSLSFENLPVEVRGI